MKINHIAMFVRDLEKTRAFYEKYFHAKANNLYHNTKTGLKTYFMAFDSGCSLEIMAKPDIDLAQKAGSHLGYAHLAFSVGSREQVDAVTNLLRNDGYDVISNPRTTGDGYYESCILDPDGNQIEIVE